MIRILVADDHLLVRKGTVELLSDFPDVEVVGEAKHGQEAVELCEKLAPDLVLMDLSMPLLDGAAATREIKKRFPKTGVIVLSGHEEEGQILRALQGGANGYLLKTASEEQLIQAVRLVASGKPAILQPEVTQAVLKSKETEELSPREVEVLRETAKDLGNKQIASVLSISERTVQQHLSNIYGKLNVTSRTGAVLKAIQLGYLTLEEPV